MEFKLQHEYHGKHGAPRNVNARQMMSTPFKSKPGFLLATPYSVQAPTAPWQLHVAVLLCKGFVDSMLSLDNSGESDAFPVNWVFDRNVQYRISCQHGQQWAFALQSSHRSKGPRRKGCALDSPCLCPASPGPEPGTRAPTTSKDVRLILLIDVTFRQADQYHLEWEMDGIPPYRDIGRTCPLFSN